MSFSWRSTRVQLSIGFAVLVIVAGLYVRPLVFRPNSSYGRLNGTVTLYPIGPICSLRSQCSRPASDQLVQVEQRSRIVAKVRTDSSGRFLFTLPAGQYSLMVPAERYGRPGVNIANPIMITRRLTVTLDVTIDTGIR